MTERFMVFLVDDDAVKCEVVPSSAYDTAILNYDLLSDDYKQLLGDVEQLRAKLAERDAETERLRGLLQEALSGPGWQDEHWRTAAEDAVGGGR